VSLGEIHLGDLQALAREILAIALVIDGQSHRSPAKLVHDLPHSHIGQHELAESGRLPTCDGRHPTIVVVCRRRSIDGGGCRRVRIGLSILTRRLQGRDGCPSVYERRVIRMMMTRRRDPYGSSSGSI
jgi:hypothetical protein